MKHSVRVSEKLGVYYSVLSQPFLFTILFLPIKTNLFLYV